MNLQKTASDGLLQHSADPSLINRVCISLKSKKEEKGEKGSCLACALGIFSYEVKRTRVRSIIYMLLDGVLD